jgi:hypothetical protein
MTRRALLLLSLAVRLRADSAGEVADLCAAMASALSEGDASSFLNAFDPAMPHYEELRTAVSALMRERELESSIEILRNEGDDARRTVELDWTMTLVDRQDRAATERRRSRVTCMAEKKGKRWRMVSLEPRDFLAPPGRP